MKLAILTASTSNQDDLVEIQRRSCFLCGIKPEEHLVVPIHDSYERHPSWFKLRALIHHLPHHENVLWMDADSMMLRDHPWFSLTCNKFTVALAKDQNGYNCGIMLWQRCPQAFEFLWSLYDDYERFKAHPWYEQGSFHVKAESFDIKEIDKSTYNAYESDCAKHSVILHLPAKPHEHRLKVMSERLQQIKR